jgi:two-component system sensor histidine kinase UhpB
MTKETKILIVEDDYFFGQLIHFQLSSGGYLDSHIQQVKSIAELKDITEFFQPEVVMLDLNILDSSGIDTYFRAKEICPASAIVILTGNEDENLANRLVKEGAQDYLLKGDANSKLLTKTIEYSRERVMQQNRVAASERKFRSVFEASPLPVITVVGDNLDIEMANDAFCELYEVEKADLDKTSLLDFCQNTIKSLLLEFDKDSFHKKLIQKTKNGKLIHAELIGNRMLSEKDSFVVLIIDRTDEDLFESKKYSLISNAQEGEKKKIARELHDGLAQNLVLLKLWFESFNIDAAQEKSISSYSDLLNNSIKEIKNISYSLLPPELDKGLLNGLKSLTDRVNMLKGSHCEFVVSNEISENTFESVDKFNIYRIIQEFINNSLKHAKAKNMWINVTAESGIWKILVKDDGVGFDKSKAQGSLGMSNIASRMEIGKLQGGVFSEIGKGTELKIIPE